MRNVYFVSYHSQRGVILIVALVMLLVMTVAGVTTMTGATLQERIAGNQRQKAVSRINADEALRAAEAYLDSLHGARSMNEGQLLADFSGASAVDADGLYMEKPFSNGGVIRQINFDRIDGAWTANNSTAVPEEASASARYVIEYLGGFDAENFGLEDDLSGDSLEGLQGGKGAADRKVFRITAIGFGNNTNVESVLESYYLEAAQQ
jgi:type IV pilus assembly protein PilX